MNTNRLHTLALEALLAERMLDEDDAVYMYVRRLL